MAPTPGLDSSYPPAPTPGGHGHGPVPTPGTLLAAPTPGADGGYYAAPTPGGPIGGPMGLAPTPGGPGVGLAFTPGAGMVAATPGGMVAATPGGPMEPHHIPLDAQQQGRGGGGGGGAGEEDLPDYRGVLVHLPGGRQGVGTRWLPGVVLEAVPVGGGEPEQLEVVELVKAQRQDMVKVVGGGSKGLKGRLISIEGGDAVLMDGTTATLAELSYIGKLADQA